MRILFLLLAAPIALTHAGTEDFRARHGIDAPRKLIHNVAVVDEEGRRTEEEYAREKGQSLRKIRSRFASTGELDCPGMTLTAQLTGSSNVITTAAHAFYNSKTCQKRDDPTACTFTIGKGIERRRSKVTSMVGNGIGMSCPTLPDVFDDWAVLKIDPPLDGMDLYQLPYATVVAEGDDVISVAASNQDFARKDARNGKKINPKTIDECQIKKVLFWNSPILFESNCDTGGGASGGTVLRVVRGTDVLVGIHSANDEGANSRAKAAQSGHANAGPYREDRWAAYHVPLAGAFLRAVEEAMASSPTRPERLCQNDRRGFENLLCH